MVNWDFVGKCPYDFVSPENLPNPVLTAKDVSDVPAELVADPFMLYDDNTLVRINGWPVSMGFRWKLMIK